MIEVDSLVEDARAVAEFEVPIGDPAIVFPFRIPCTYGEWAQFNKDKREWVDAHKSAPAPNPAWKDLWPRDAESLGALYTLTTFCKELPMGEAVKLLRAPLIIETLLSAINLHRAHKTAEVWGAMVSGAKKNSEMTTDTDSALPSAETPSESTSTN